MITQVRIQMRTQVNSNDDSSVDFSEDSNHDSNVDSERTQEAARWRGQKAKSLGLNRTVKRARREFVSDYQSKQVKTVNWNQTVKWLHLSSNIHTLRIGCLNVTQRQGILKP